MLYVAQVDLELYAIDCNGKKGESFVFGARPLGIQYPPSPSSLSGVGLVTWSCEQASIADLKRDCLDRGINCFGARQDLIQRLIEHDANEQADREHAAAHQVEASEPLREAPPMRPLLGPLLHHDEEYIRVESPEPELYSSDTIEAALSRTDSEACHNAIGSLLSLWRDVQQGRARIRECEETMDGFEAKLAAVAAAGSQALHDREAISASALEEAEIRLGGLAESFWSLQSNLDSPEVRTHPHTHIHSHTCVYAPIYTHTHTHVLATP